MFDEDPYVLHRISDSGKVQRIETEEYQKGNLPSSEDLDIGEMGFSFDLKDTPAAILKKDLEDSIERGYGDLSRGTKIRVLKEITKRLEFEGEERRQAEKGVHRK